ncbi:MAG: EAL domain-containing protein [Allopontixanthobacter sediminis]
MIPLNWARMGAIIALAYATATLLARDLPPPLIGGLAWGAVLLTMIGAHIARRERKAATPMTAVPGVAASCIGLPQALTGLGFGQWIVAYGLDPRLGLGALLAINAVSLTLLIRRPSQLYIGMAGLWAPVALLDGSLMAIGSIVLVGIVLFVSARIQGDVEHDDLDWLLARERACDRYEDILRDYEEMGHGWFWETDRRGHLSYVSPIVGDAVGEHHENLIGRPLDALFDQDSKPAESARALAFHISTRSPFHDLAFPAAAGDDERWWSVSGRPVFDDFQNFVGFRGSGTDLTERRRTQESASRLALYDSLTGLANRFQTMQTLGRILGSPQEIPQECSLFLLDLDRFKQVNDTFGHPAGDALLKQVAQRLEKTVGDAGVVGRLGGDEFTVIVAGGPDRSQLGKLSHEIIYALSQPYWLDGQRVVIGASIGIAIAPADGHSSDALIRSADLALYASKNGGRGRYQFYSENLLSASEERAGLERALRLAIAEGGLELYYQPIVHTATERITGFEALLRWNHPEMGWIPPAKFVPIAEDAGLISTIGDWAIRTACQDLALWPDDIRCAVNVSSLQLSNPQFPAVVTQALARSGIAPDRLELEITESAFLNDGPGTGTLLAALKSIGVRLALDDFGTGYSSFAYLENAPFDKIKIDRRFVRNAAVPGSRKGAMIAAMTTLAQNLGIDTTAEGVETMDELNLVRMHGCSHVQGHVYEKPLSGVNALTRLRSGVAAVADGPRSSREPRQTVLRKVLLEHGNEVYSGTIRNISSRGVMIEGLWDVPGGTLFQLALSEFHTVLATCRWSESGRMGAEFNTPLKRDSAGTLIAIKGPPSGQHANLLPHKF